MKANWLLKFLVSMLALSLVACGGSSDESGYAAPENPTPERLDTYAEEFRFLNQASMGATEAEARRVADMGYEAWIDEQMQLPTSLYTPHVKEIFEATGDVQTGSLAGAWVRNALRGPDQLRQRVALALSEILVVSKTGLLMFHLWELPLASYYDVLSKHAFGNYRELLEEVTLHPAMGNYLSMLGNLKPDPEQNIRPDENFARELMQLFTIGLVELNLDGTEKTDEAGRPIPTYTQETIEGFAHVFTGWNYRKRADDPPEPIWPTHISRREPMVLYPDRHDTGEKTLLRGVTLPARSDGEQDLQDALDNVFGHPNVAPFISVRLIQRLVTSNPSRAYVERIARVFNDNGAGVRGDLGAVVKAILLDPEARPTSLSPIDGKLKEPMLRLTQLWRAYGAVEADRSHRLVIDSMTDRIGQGPLEAESVFNFFLPTYAPAGEISDLQLVAPEMQIITDYLSALHVSYLYRQTHHWHKLSEPIAAGFRGTPDLLIDFNADLQYEDDTDALIDRVAYKLLGGKISPELRAQVERLVSATPADKAGKRTAAAMFFVASSPEYAYQH